jgi:G3E family GTPase
VIILNKIDLVSDDQQAQIRTLVQKLNPDAEIVLSDHGNVPMKKIINTKKFDFEKA